MSEYLLETRDLAKSYDGGRIQALRGVDLQVASGEFVAIRGPSGSGKSTLLHLLGGLDTPSRGEVFYRGRSLSQHPSLNAYRSRCVGFVFQAFHLLPALTALQNVQVPMCGGNRTRRQRLEKAETLLREVGLEERFQQYPNELSAGERQRVAIARSLANEPEILLADEPTGNLDTDSAATILDLLGGLHSGRSMTLLVVTHDPEVAARAQRQVNFRNGSICA
ncbi:MAG TPA: ABC transporter ATP-binding protein [Bryobacteraceae bacterium]|nr:ABC transporter ATP-binding protein [Bryobacteraceae bacterium]